MQPSPNHTGRRGRGRPALVVVHYTGMASADAAVARLRDPAAEVSAHYLVTADGQIVRMVDEIRRAWHAGASAWGDIADVNSWSVGIELANPGPLDALPPFPEAQMRAAEGLIGGIRDRWSIAPECVLGHACVAPGRKSDPGPKFDWRRLAAGGNSIWLDPPVVPGSGSADAGRFRDAARRFGYGVDRGPGWTDRLKAVWAAFSLRFLVPTALGAGRPTSAGIAHLEALAERWPVKPLDPGAGTA